MRLGFAVVTTIVVVGLVAAGLLSSEEEATALDGETVRSQALEALESKPAFKVVSRPAGAASGRSQETVTEWWAAKGRCKSDGLTAFLVRGSKSASQMRFVDSENRACAFEMQVVTGSEQE